MKKSKILFGALLLPAAALALCAGSFAWQNHALGALGEPDAHVHDGMTLLGDGDSLPSAPGSYCLTSDLVVSSTWSVPTGETRLCLNGHGIRKTGSGSLISVASGATLSIDDCGETVHYFDVDATNHYAKNINESEGSGRSSFTGGYITGCTEIYAIAITGGTLNLNGGTIIGNYQNNGGKGVGVNVGNGGTFNMHGGTISYNYCQNAGGGVMVRNGNMYMDGGVITHNKTGWAGGSAIAVHFTNESDIPTHAHISGGVIENNYTQNTYGAIDVNTGKSNIFEIEGSPRIRNNWNNDTNDTTERNISLRSDYGVTAKVKLSAPLEEGPNISVRLHYNNGLGAFTEGWTTHMQGADPADYFFAEDPTKDFYVDATGEAAIFNGGEGALVGSEAGWTHYQTLADAVNAWGDGQTLKLLANASYNLAVSSGTKTLDLNDHALSAISVDSNAIDVTGGSLHIVDSCARKTHYYVTNNEGAATLSETPTDDSFKGGYIGGGAGRAVVVTGGEVTLSSGTLFGNDYSKDNNSGREGAGVYIGANGHFTLEGTGAIIGNYAGRSAGVCVYGTFDMKGGLVRYNSAQFHTGGMCVWGGGSMNLTGGEISGNYGHSWPASGVYMDSNATVNLGGNPKVFDNYYLTTLKNFGYYPQKPPVLSEPLTEGARIDVFAGVNATAATTASNPYVLIPNWSDVMGDADPYDYFHCDPIYSTNGTTFLANYEPYVVNGQAVVSPIDFVVHFDGNSGAGTMEDFHANTRHYVLPANGFDAPEGRRFLGWNIDGELHIPGEEIRLSGDISLVAQWSKAPDVDWVGLSGIVYQNDGVTPASGAAVKLYQGDEIYDFVHAGAEGEYQLTCPDGYYNLVAEHGGVSMTILVKVAGVTVKDIVLGSAKTESILTVEEGLAITVGGLDEVAEGIRADEGVSAEQYVSVSMNVEAKTEESAENADEIVEAAPEQNLEFYEIKVEKTIDDVTTTLDSTSNVIEIVIPYENATKREVAVYSYHDGAVITYTRSDTHADGTFSLDKDNGLVKIYTSKFSTFAIGYTPYYSLNATVTLGSYTGLVTATLTSADTNEVVAELVDIELSEVHFDDLPRGDYLLTITWVDGASNSISMPVHVG